jgi:hypothetical protein
MDSSPSGTVRVIPGDPPAFEVPARSYVPPPRWWLELMAWLAGHPIHLEAAPLRVEVLTTHEEVSHDDDD